MGTSMYLNGTNLLASSLFIFDFEIVMLKIKKWVFLMFSGSSDSVRDSGNGSVRDSGNGSVRNVRSVRNGACSIGLLMHGGLLL